MHPPGPIAIVLPPKEGFGPGRSGAIGLIVSQLCHAWDGQADAPAQVVLGAPQEGTLFPGIDYRPVRAPRWLPLPATRRYAWAAALMLRTGPRPALVEVHNRAAVALTLAARLAPVPVALVLHNDPRAMAGLARPAARARLLACLAGVVCVSDFIRNCLLEGVPAPLARRAHVRLNAVPLAALPPPAAVRERLILFVGRVVRDKGADSFVRACALALPHLPGWRAEMIGADRFSPDSPETDFIRALRPEAAAAGVAMLGYLPHGETAAAMARAAIVVVPSRWEDPCPLVAIEAMAAGAALITSRRGGLPELGGEAAVYADPDDPAALAGAIRVLAGEPARLEAAQEACRARALGFDLEAARHGWAALRAELISAATSPT
jgi:glycosyltransferase involved in cell wall biosynthesis